MATRPSPGMSSQPPTSSRVPTRTSCSATGRIEFGAPPGLAEVVREPVPLQRGQLAVSPDADPDEDPHPNRDQDRGPCRIVVATSFPAFADGLVSWLDDEQRQWRVTTTCVSGPALLAAVCEMPAGVIVATDEIGPPGLFGEVCARSPESRMLVLTSVDAPERDAALVRCGVLAVIPARSSRRETVRAVGELLEGRTVVSAEALGVIIAAPRVDGPGLTGRQREVLELLAVGQTTAQIAERLVVTPSTVKTHLRVIGERFGVSGHRALAVNARRLLDDATPVVAGPSPPPRFISQTM